MFKKILIANRGEIAVRIIRACQELGIQTVAVYSEADARALHVRLADEAVLIGPPPPAESYLRAERIIEVAQQQGCEAIHPGYGFLAENAGFAAAVTAAGLTFIGPTPEAMQVMGSKISARRAMQAAGVPVVPGSGEEWEVGRLGGGKEESRGTGEQRSGGAEGQGRVRGGGERKADEVLLAEAEAVGFPLLVKAAAGGGGKGMRLVQTMAELPHAIESSRREARNAFGDDELYLEKYLASPRHIEFQVFGDQSGNIVHLFERECSVQRRHQKIIEESPSPLLNEQTELRRRMGEAAVAAARAVNYLNAGTIEFLVDADLNFYFLEMNTRLQVEHPVTELVTGLDLVKLQLRVAAGQPLPFGQEDLLQRGHAIECRLYAEDPANDFLPVTGQVLRVIEPAGPGVRVDSSLSSGDEVTRHYDPLLAKLIVLAEDRQEALRKMAWALPNYIVLGLTTNIPFLQEVIRHEVFQRGEATTGFVEQYFAGWQPVEGLPPDLALITAALAELFEEEQGRVGEWESGRVGGRGQRGGGARESYSPWRRLNNFRLGEG